MRERPASSEFPDTYIRRYVDLVPDGDIEEILRRQRTETMSLLQGVSEEFARRAYAPDKWSLKEVIGHISDTERVMAYRMLAIARNDRSPLPSMDQDLYVSSAHFDQFPWAQLQADFDAVRSATLSLLATLDDAAWVRLGSLWNSTVSPRALAYIIAGHELHHLAIIRDKYL